MPTLCGIVWLVLPVIGLLERAGLRERALFTAIMGNAYAAVPVTTAAVGLPPVMRRFGGGPAVACALGMLSGFCGTLVAPMAANPDVVPAALLELPDRNGAIRAQAPAAAILLLGNTVPMHALAFSR